MRIARCFAILFCLGFQVALAGDIATYQKAVTEGDSNSAVKLKMELGLFALQTGEYDIARENLDYVLSDIESLFSNHEDAIKARSIWYEEGRKSFKGEPYERAMAYYYRGLLYLIEGEPDNARASFLSGGLQDAFAEEDQHRSDFVLLMLMEAWAASLMGSLGLRIDIEKDIATLRPSVRMPTPDTHALVVVETGKAPRKLQDGISGEKLVYRRGKRFKDKFAAVVTPGGSYPIHLDPIEDILFQAHSRGSRIIDHINKGQAVYKSNWIDVTTTVSGLANQLTLLQNLTRDYSAHYESEGGNTINVEVRGVNFGAVALSSSMIALIATKMKPRADDRFWNNLPDTVHVGFVPLSELSTEEQSGLVLYDTAGRELERKSLSFFPTGESGYMAWEKVH